MNKKGWLAPKPLTVIYVDGSYLHHAGIGGWAAIIIQGDDVTEMCGTEQQTTSNRMEMLGALRALQSIATGSNVYLVTDSQYLKNSASVWIHKWKVNGWKSVNGHAIANQDLLELLDIECKRHVVSWHWVKGHAGDVYNELCDELAMRAVEARWIFINGIKEPV